MCAYLPSSKLHPLDTVAGLLDLSLLYHSWLCGVFLLVTWYTAWLLFRIYASEVGICHCILLATKGAFVLEAILTTSYPFKLEYHRNYGNRVHLFAVGDLYIPLYSFSFRAGSLSIMLV